ncbi:MAG: EF2563 family selenium-dependent molybdenum hydroxylase system protein [Proteobacteria bacterium]|nr:EF2563 family selenium-dependent molybdenum hydroxylase system protein [Pseudomonadota bacterium]
MASAVAWRLVRSHFQVVMTEVPSPLAVRRRVSFCEAVHDGASRVEGLTGRLVDRPERAREVISAGEVPVLVDPELDCLGALRPDVLVEATLAKRNTGLTPDLAPLTIALGPGYDAGRDADLVIETNRGHHLGRIIDQGPAAPNTGVPGDIGGQSGKRVLRAPADGEFLTDLQLGALVRVGQEVATVGGRPVTSLLDGLLRGLIRPGTRVHEGLKVGDVDPRGDVSHLDTISDKARAVAGSVLEAVLRVYNR